MSFNIKFLAARAWECRSFSVPNQKRENAASFRFPLNRKEVLSPCPSPPNHPHPLQTHSKKFQQAGAP
jgi:hypothetical protein